MSAVVQRPGRARRYAKARDRQVKFRATADEYALLAEAARSAGLTPSGYAAEAALAAARGVQAPSLTPVREALVELMAARTQVRRFAVNVNQAVRALNATGEAPEWLSAAVAVTDRAVERLDGAAADLVHAARIAQRPAAASPLRLTPGEER
ncbi:plasmid mobilization protein [Quadrisphaera sp. KR29]|uniref:plasmid mobilization protein n=1 Tax=Quadrisphaera sp. KR29 TaxID=3461391 RepID=UPI00404416D6